MAANIGALSNALSVTPALRTSADALVPAPSANGGSTSAFVAFPSNYDGFGNDGKGFGQIGITNGALGIVGHANGALGIVGHANGALGVVGSTSPSSSVSTNASKTPAASASNSTPYPLDPQTGLARIATAGALAQVDERIAISNAQGQFGAAAQLQPYATQLNARLNYQLFAGLGTTPAQPFAQPEIPRVFLNVPA